jgi:eukaryotic-like serine/threonine-protein kinase
VTVCPADAAFGLTWDLSGIVFGQGPRGIFRCSPNGGAPEKLATVGPGEQAHGPQILPGGEALLYSIAKTADGATRWDRALIVVQQLKSGERKTLVEGGSDGRYVPTGHLLYSVGGVMFAVGFDLRRVQIVGSPVPIVDGVRRSRGATTGTADLATSDTGTLMYMPGPSRTVSNQREIASADRAGMITRLTIPAGPYSHVRASRDGKYLAVGSDDGKEAIVYIYELAGTNAMRRLTLEGHNRFPVWSPDGQRVAFQSDRGGDFSIFAQRADGSGSAERLTMAEKDVAHVPESWSPDGRHLVFSVVKGSAMSLSTLTLATKKVEPYGNVQSSEPIEPVFSPDGRWIAYSSSGTVGGNLGGNTPNRGVYIQPFPATGEMYQVPKQAIDFHPVWSPDGRDLIYVPLGVSGQLVSVRVTRQPVVSFGTPERLPARVTGDRLSGEMRAYDVLPDGRFIGVITPSAIDGSGSPVPTQFRVVVNWFEELKQRVPVK